MSDKSESLEIASGKNRESENFPVGSWLIRPALRPHIHAYYGFARAADDIADHPLLPADEKIRRLQRFADVLQAGAGEDVPSACAMHKSLAATGISPQHCHDLLHAFRQDAVKTRYATQAELLDYCRYSAAPVGRYVLALHGVGAAAWPASDALCTVLQIINHLQDCSADYASLNRVYLPLDALAQCDASAADLAQARSSPALRQVITLQLQAMQPLLRQARQLPRQITDLRLKLEVQIIVALAADLLKLLAKRDPLSQNVKLSKAGIVFSCLKGLVGV